MTVLGAGYVGGRLVRQAVGRGLRVTALTRNRSVADRLKDLGGVDVVCGLLEDDAWHSRIPPDQDLVVNCVGAGGGGLAGYRRSYLEGQESINRWLAGGRVRVLIYTGSIGVYPQDDGSRVDETAPAGGHSEFADVLLEAERRVLEAGGPDLRRFILRLAGIYGPGRHFLLDRLRAGEPIPGDPGAVMNAVHLDDICGAVWSAAAGARPGSDGVYNVVDDLPATRREVAGWLASRLGLPEPVFDPSVSGPRGRRARSRHRRIANEKIKATFGWTPRFPTYREGYTAILKTGDATGPVRSAPS